jgi:hypothetical protein
MLTSAHLHYLQTLLYIHRQIDGISQASEPTLLCIANEMLDVVLQLGSSCHRAIFVRHDFEYMVCPILTLLCSLQAMQAETSYHMEIARLTRQGRCTRSAKRGHPGTEPTRCHTAEVPCSAIQEIALDSKSFRLPLSPQNYMPA